MSTKLTLEEIEHIRTNAGSPIQSKSLVLALCDMAILGCAYPQLIDKRNAAAMELEAEYRQVVDDKRRLMEALRDQLCNDDPVARKQAQALLAELQTR